MYCRLIGLGGVGCDQVEVKVSNNGGIKGGGNYI
jgi:hypothetical protein